MDGTLFWADKIAQEILERKRFHYLDKPVPAMKECTVKTSASMSGVLHIGRLSDTIRSESVFRALVDAGAKACFIWVAEDMDPLRKVPKGVPKEYEQYLGMPVTDIPDPDGCHRSYAEHHKEAYLKVIEKFVGSPMQKFSMREEYRKGTFRPYVKSILEKAQAVREIQNRYRSAPVQTGWSPWLPICEECGKIITPRVERMEGGKVHYKCQDYKFATTVAKGCGHEGVDDPLKCNGKLVWKSEWACQWAHWKVASEGAGKEYQVPMSAWWVNGEIVERVLDFPMPVPIFYEHLMIDGKKMSASLGNVVYPKDWLEVAPPELLRLFYNKRLMKTRSFSFKDLPKVYDDYDLHARVFAGEEHGNEKEAAHMKRLYAISQRGKPDAPNPLPFDFAVMLSQTTHDPASIEKMLKDSGHIKGKLAPAQKKAVLGRIACAAVWVSKHAPEQAISLAASVTAETKAKLSSEERAALKELSSMLPKASGQELHDAFWNVAKAHGLKPQQLFRAAYLALLGKESGPKLAPFILASGRDKVRKLLESL